jgi:hypothetical protein
LEGNPYSITVTDETNSGMPVYASTDNYYLNINASSVEYTGTHILKVTVCDEGPLCSNYTMEVIFTNTAPYFIDAPFDYTTYNNLTGDIYWLPAYEDAEGNPVTITLN